MIIDATDLVLGRMAAQVAKLAILGEEISIINSEKAVITGDKKGIVEKYRHRAVYRGQPKTGPFFFTKENLFVKRAIRGMLPHKRPKGRDALKRIKCYIGVPEEFKDKKTEVLSGVHVSKMQNLKYISVKEICHLMGRKDPREQ